MAISGLQSYHLHVCLVSHCSLCLAKDSQHQTQGQQPGSSTPWGSGGVGGDELRRAWKARDSSRSQGPGTVQGAKEPAPRRLGSLQIPSNPSLEAHEEVKKVKKVEKVKKVKKVKKGGPRSPGPPLGNLDPLAFSSMLLMWTCL